MTRRLLNLGCGIKVCAHPDFVNIDWSLFLVWKRNRVLRGLSPFVLRGGRLKDFKSLPIDNIMVHNLARGIPFPDSYADVAYHSHLLEHLDRDAALRFLQENLRVLKQGGVLRVVVPDFEALSRKYLSHVELSALDSREIAQHDGYIASILEQSVRREAFGTSQQSGVRRFAENLLLGDARRRGETHQWMYDQFNLTHLLLKAGFRNPERHAYNSSAIEDWSEYGLDMDDKGGEYKPGSLYMEAGK